MKTPIPYCCAVLAAMAFAEAAPAIQSDQTMDEVNVIAGQLQPWELRKMLAELEDRFYDRFNALNDRDEFDVNCINTANTGTNLKHRECRPVFEVRAIQKQGREIFLIRQDIQNQYPMIKRAPSGIAMTAVAEIEIARPKYRAHMASVVQGDKTLRELLQQRATLEGALKAKKGPAPAP